MEEQNPNPKWEGMVSAELTRATADQIWRLLSDFFNFHKWFPTLATCYGVHGANREPGCVRFCSGFSIPSHGGSPEAVSWSKERLTAIDDTGRSLSYEMVESNIGFKSYVSTLKVGPPCIGGGCVVEWSFAVDPVEGLALEDLVKKYEVGLLLMARKMEDAFN